MKITEEWIKKNMTKGVGINATQLRLLGLRYPPKNGWLKRLIGKQIDDESARLFVLSQTKEK